MALSDAQVRSVEVTRDNGARGTIGVYGNGNDNGVKHVWAHNIKIIRRIINEFDCDKMFNLKSIILNVHIHSSLYLLASLSI